MERYTQYHGVDVYWSTGNGPDIWSWEQHRATLTTEHAASSYGVPVLVEDNGQVYGPSEITHRLSIAVSPTYTTPLIEAARAAGYDVHSEGWGLGSTPPAMMPDMLHD